jgi:hypothetical protein
MPEAKGPRIDAIRSRVSFYGGRDLRAAKVSTEVCAESNFLPADIGLFGCKLEKEQTKPGAPMCDRFIRDGFLPGLGFQQELVYSNCLPNLSQRDFGNKITGYLPTNFYNSAQDQRKYIEAMKKFSSILNSNSSEWQSTPTAERSLGAYFLWAIVIAVPTIVLILGLCSLGKYITNNWCNSNNQSNSEQQPLARQMTPF